MPPAELTVELGAWDALRAEAEPIRTAVFVIEQKVPAEIEIDEFDPVSVHAIARDRAGRPLGTGRLLPDGHIGRMAVLREARGRGVGAALLAALIEEARRRGHAEVVLSAQLHAVPFYARFGFAVAGDTFEEAGIAHVTMRRRL
ncbi:MAG TPA: GNAT family N-acetyltransferase [Burkholderiaceae bacterium]|jgi:predicted GNAT family N-acyltransferase|nr:GNAT family N-acetyltransferase [Burkholderiaceae bacterium]